MNRDSRIANTGILKSITVFLYDLILDKLILDLMYSEQRFVRTFGVKGSSFSECNC